VSALKRAQPPSARAEPHDLAVSGVNDLASSSAAGQRHARPGRIRKWDATDAAVHDSQKLDDVLDDKDARWTKKNDESFYGYKNHQSAPLPLTPRCRP
jgi:hypothetical protein